MENKKDINSDNIKEWPTDAEENTTDWQRNCIESISVDIIDELEKYDVEFEEWHISERISDFIESACIYRDDCEEIIKQLDYDIWSDDPMIGQRASSLMQAAIWALEGALYDIDIQEQIKEKVLENGKNNK